MPFAGIGLRMPAPSIQVENDSIAFSAEESNEENMQHQPADRARKFIRRASIFVEGIFSNSPSRRNSDQSNASGQKKSKTNGFLTADDNSQGKGPSDGGLHSAPHSHKHFRVRSNSIMLTTNQLRKRFNSKFLYKPTAIFGLFQILSGLLLLIFGYYSMSWRAALGYTGFGICGGISSLCCGILAVHASFKRSFFFVNLLQSIAGLTVLVCVTTIIFSSIGISIDNRAQYDLHPPTKSETARKLLINIGIFITSGICYCCSVLEVVSSCQGMFVAEEGMAKTSKVSPE